MLSIPLSARDLEPAEIEDILKRNDVGRIAYAWHDHVDIEPIHYVYRHGVLYGRTSEGTKLNLLRYSWTVAFEVDEVDGPFDWRSVVVHGGFYRLEPTGSKEAPERYREAVDVIRSLTPTAFGPDDPMPSRNVVFKVFVHKASGRSLSSHDAAVA